MFVTPAADAAGIPFANATRVVAAQPSLKGPVAAARRPKDRYNDRLRSKIIATGKVP
jgi:hypothetical protein